MGNISEAKLAEDSYTSDAYIMDNRDTSTRGKKYTIHYKVWHSLLAVDRNPNSSRVEITMANIIDAMSNYGHHITFYVKTDANGKIDFNDFRNSFEINVCNLYSKLYGVNMKEMDYSVYRYGNQKATKTFKAVIKNSSSTVK